MAQAAIKDPFAKPAIAAPKTTGKLPRLVSTTLENAGGANGVKQSNLNDTGGPEQIKQTPAVKSGTAGAAPAPQPTSTGTAVAPAAAPPPVSPFLTPDQTDAFNQAWYKYQGGVNNLTEQLGNAQVNEAQTLQNDQAQYTVNTEAANAQAAARGMFTSSIKQGALNDIAATKANNDYSAASALAALGTSINSQIDLLNQGWGSTQSASAAEAIANAQNVTPTVASPAAAPASPAAPAYAPGGTPLNGGVPGAGAGAAYIKQVEKNPADWRPAWAETAKSKSKGK